MRRERAKSETETREELAWRLRSAGLTQMAVAEQIGISQPGVCKILARVSERLKGEFVAEVLSAKLQQSAILSHIAQEAMSAWEESKQDAVTETKVTGKITGDGDEKGKSRAQVTRTVVGQCGNPALLSAAMKALGDIRSIWGLDSPTKAEVSGPQGKPIEYRDAGISLDSKISRLAAALAQGEAAGEPDG